MKLLHRLAQYRRLAALTLALGLSTLAPTAHANEAIHKAVEARFEVKVDKINKIDQLGLYEVFADGQMFYTDEKASAFFIGNLIDAKTGANLTAIRMMSFLPLDLAVKQVMGNGKGTVITFEDPNCGYCKRLARTLQKLKNGTVYTFMIPILGEDSVTKTKGIWCAADRAKAWNDWMIDNKAPKEPKKDCKPPIERLMAVGQGFQITGTPTLMFEDGMRVPGALPIAQIEKKLAELAKKD